MTFHLDKRINSSLLAVPVNLVFVTIVLYRHNGIDAAVSTMESISAFWEHTLRL